MDLHEKSRNANRHPWEISRAHEILKQCREVFGDTHNLVLADIGAGDMFFDSKLIELFHEQGITVAAVDTGYTEEDKSPSKDIIMKTDISQINNNSLDGCLMMDVLEHVEKDDVFLNQVVSKLKPAGKLVITVPAFQSLFSEHDKFLKHYRRYDKKMMLNLVQKIKNLKIKKVHYFYTSLYLARWLQKITVGADKIDFKDQGIGGWKYSDKNILTVVIKNILNFDFAVDVFVSKIGFKLPGLSLFLVCEKRS